MPPLNIIPRRLRGWIIERAEKNNRWRQPVEVDAYIHTYTHTHTYAIALHRQRSACVQPHRNADFIARNVLDPPLYFPSIFICKAEDINICLSHFRISDRYIFITECFVLLHFTYNTWTYRTERKSKTSLDRHIIYLAIPVRYTAIFFFWLILIDSFLQWMCFVFMCQY